MKPEEVMTYCGGYCAMCARFSGYTAFREAALLLAEVVDAHGFRHWLPDAVDAFDYAEFRKGLAFFAAPDSWLVCKRGCRDGSGGPPFCVRDCCREHKVDICFECEAFPCEKTRAFQGMAERAQEYRALGRVEWLRRQAERAERGYEAHTGVCYQVSRCSETPGPASAATSAGPRPCGPQSGSAVA